MTESNTLSIEGIDCVRGDKTLFQGLRSHVQSNQCLHIIGANGCGKTSLLRIIAGLASPEAGSVLWNDKNTTNNSNYLNESVYIGHKDALKNELTAIENLRFYKNLETNPQNSQEKSVTKQDKENLLDDCLNKLEILHCADLFAQQLSFGQRRRLAFARLLLKPYKLWILDEPFTGIDVNGRQIIESLCINHLSNGGTIILTHHQSLQESVLHDYLSELHLENFTQHNSNQMSESH